MPKKLFADIPVYGPLDAVRFKRSAAQSRARLAQMSADERAEHDLRLADAELVRDAVAEAEGQTKH